MPTGRGESHPAKCGNPECPNPAAGFEVKESRVRYETQAKPGTGDVEQAPAAVEVTWACVACGGKVKTEVPAE